MPDVSTGPPIPPVPGGSRHALPVKESCRMGERLGLAAIIRPSRAGGFLVNQNVCNQPQGAVARRNIALSVAVAAVLVLPTSARAHSSSTPATRTSRSAWTTPSGSTSPLESPARTRRSWAIPISTTATATSTPAACSLASTCSPSSTWSGSVAGLPRQRHRLVGRGLQHLDNRSIDTSNNLQKRPAVLGLDPHAKRYAEGPSGEFLDVFAFAKFNVGEAPVNIKLGQTTVYWGEGLLLGGAVHGISYSQNPIDLWKGFATPGAEAKELFRPRVGFNVQSQVTDDLSIAAQYFFNWQSFDNQAYRYPEAGTFLSVGDPLLWAGESFIVAPNAFRALVPGAPGLPACLAGQGHPAGGELGQLRCRPCAGARTGLTGPSGVLPSHLRHAAAADADARTGYDGAGADLALRSVASRSASRHAASSTSRRRTCRSCAAQASSANTTPPSARTSTCFGLSLSKQVLGVSVGAELNYRQNMPLVSEAVQVLPAPLVNPQSWPDLDDRGAQVRNAGRARRHDARHRQSAGPRRHDAALGYGELGHRAHLDDRPRREPERGRVQGPQQQQVRAVHPDRSPGRQFLRPGRSTSRRPGSRSCRAWTCWPR